MNTTLFTHCVLLLRSSSYQIDNNKNMKKYKKMKHKINIYAYKTDLNRCIYHYIYTELNRKQICIFKTHILNIQTNIKNDKQNPKTITIEMNIAT